MHCTESEHWFAKKRTFLLPFVSSYFLHWILHTLYLGGFNCPIIALSKSLDVSPPMHQDCWQNRRKNTLLEIICQINSNRENVHGHALSILQSAIFYMLSAYCSIWILHLNPEFESCIMKPTLSILRIVWCFKMPAWGIRELAWGIEKSFLGIKRATWGNKKS